MSNLSKYIKYTWIYKYVHSADYSMNHPQQQHPEMFHLSAPEIRSHSP